MIKSNKHQNKAPGRIFAYINIYIYIYIYYNIYVYIRDIKQLYSREKTCGAHLFLKEKQIKGFDFQNFNYGSCYNFSIKFREINPNDADIRNLNVNSISTKFDQLKYFIMRETNVNH